MASSLIRGKYVVAKVNSRTEAQVIEDGAIFQRDGVIVEVGPHRDLAAKYQPDEVIGSAEHVVIPGSTNSHHHVGLTPIQMGARDLSLELWFAERMMNRAVDPYLDTLYSAFEMIESGTTTVQHLHGWMRGDVKTVTGNIEKLLKAYQDIGMRVSYSYAIRDQNRLSYMSDDELVEYVGPELGANVQWHLNNLAMTADEQLGTFVDLWNRYNQQDRIKVQLAPANLHWCSDETLLKIQEHSSRHKVPIHMHLLETAYQKEYALRRSGKTAVQHVHDLGMLGPHMTFGHGVWISEEDIDRLAETDTIICHNASSNLRLRSGILPLNQLAAKGVRAGIGLDEAGINDDRDMLQEMKLVLHLHRVPGMEEDEVPTAPQVLRMATEYGAQTTGFGPNTGTLEAGKAADMAVLSWKQIAYPYLDAAIAPLNAIVTRAKSSGVHAVLVAGEVIYRDGRFTRVDKAAVLEELAASLKVPLTSDELRRRETSRGLIPHLKRFYRDYLARQVRVPFYQQSTRQ